MEPADHIATIGREARLFAEAATIGGPDVTIPTCPGWVMRDLVRHLSEIHLWAAAHVALRATKMWVDELDELAAYWPDLAVFWPDDAELVDHYLATNANLMRELESAPADVEAMTFLPAPSPLAMWARRQAHEISIHRYDAQNASGGVTDFDPEFAADGLDELLLAFAPRVTAFPVETVRTMAVSATDTGDHWRVTMSPEGIDTVRGAGPSDAILTGRAADLYLTLWNRGDDAAIDVSGDESLVETWHANHRIRWS